MLDRDGTLIVERHYLSSPDQVELLPYAAEGLQRLRQLGLGLVVVTNQSGVARGYFTLERVREIHERMKELLTPHGVMLDGIYVCPHLPSDNCACRKPRTGLVNTAAGELGFDPSAGFVIGDKPCDIELGQALKAPTFLVRTGYGAKHEKARSTQADYVVDNIVEAAKVIEQLLNVAPPGRNALS